MRIDTWRRIETWTTVAMVCAGVFRLLANHVAEDIEPAASVTLAVTLAASLLSWLGLRFAQARHDARGTVPGNGTAGASQRLRAR